ncbi:MAG: fibronectin type III domain-containing protein, partial [Rhodospirillales bacterium]|nr:fibronectin type III domain-containing protein [Rhodospirillales bacterium]
MKCARREAGAHRPAASTPPRSPSSRRTPPRDRSRADPPGGRTRLFHLLPVFALLVGALGLFTAAPAQAQSTTEVWSATLTVDEDAGYYGCDNDHGTQADCSTALDDDDFDYGGKSYTVGVVFWNSNDDQFSIGFGAFGAATKTALGSLTMNVDGTALAVSDSAVGVSDIFWTFDPDPDWVDGGTVTLSLTAPVSKPAKPTGLTATVGDQRAELSWTDPSDSSITKYQYQKKAGSAAWDTSWTDIPSSAPGEMNATSYTVTGLTNGTAYRFRIRAVN